MAMLMLLQLDQENARLKAQLENLLREGRRNEDRMRRMDKIERQLIGATSLGELIRLLLSEYRAAFGVEQATLTLIDRELVLAELLNENSDTPAPARLCPTLLPAATGILGLYAHGMVPWLGRYQHLQHAALFHSPVIGIESVALLPLVRQGELIGSLHLGSRNPERYGAASGTEFLERFAGIVAVCLESALNRDRLRRVSLTDGLTGVQNRRYFEQRCKIEVSQAKRHQLPLACMFVDVDHFKLVNDSYGHHTGDDVLRIVAADIQGRLRAGDTVARYGGEEFVVTLPRTDQTGALEIAERIRKSIEAKTFPTRCGKNINVTISIGLTMLHSDQIQQDHQVAATQLVAHADKALYQAKNNGRNRVEWVTLSL
jgi:diguanylate cyclase (GGDEF)-like protein